MVKITACDVTECAYNKHNSCHTMAITVGDPDMKTPHCDTYIKYDKGGIPDMKAGVGACKVADCTYNESLECNAQSIQVGVRSTEADCMTFRER